MLSDEQYQPVTSDAFVLPANGVLVQNDAYQDFAPKPASQPQTAPGGLRLPELEQATFLVQVIATSGPACPVGGTCPLPAVDLWAIQARVDPWPAPGSQPAVTPSPGPAAVAPVLPLTVAQLNTYMAMNSQSPDGRQLVITGTIASVPPPAGSAAGTACRYSGRSWTCPPAYLVGSEPRLSIEPIGDIGPGPWAQGGPQVLTGTFVATLESYSLRYQGPVETTAAGDPWLPGQLPKPTEAAVGVGYWLVHGWIASPPIDPACPTEPSPYPGPQYTCGVQTTLSDSAYDAQTVRCC